MDDHRKKRTSQDNLNNFPQKRFRMEPTTSNQGN